MTESAPLQTKSAPLQTKSAPHYVFKWLVSNVL